MPCHILVTGGSGYISTVLCPYLIRLGFKVTSLDTNYFSKETNCQLGIENPLSSSDHIKYIKCNMHHFSDEFLDGIDAVVNLAGISNDPMLNFDSSIVCDPTRLYSYHIAKLCKARNIRFIFASSCSIYGFNDSELVSEDSIPNPQTGYSLKKLQIEYDLRLLADSIFSPIALRFANVFGPSPKIRLDIVINMLVGLALSNRKITLNSDGTSWRPNLHILDACQAILCALQTNISSPELTVINIGDEMNNMKIIDIAETISSITKPPIEFLNSSDNSVSSNLVRDRKISGRDTRSYSVDFSLIRQTFPQYTIQYSIEEGIHDLIQFFEYNNFSQSDFFNAGFYRLQHLEFLLQNERLDNNLFWIK